MATKKIVAEQKREEGRKEGRRGRGSRSLLKGALIERQEKNESKRAVRPSGIAYTCTLTLAMNQHQTTNHYSAVGRYFHVLSHGQVLKIINRADERKLDDVGESQEEQIADEIECWA